FHAFWRTTTMHPVSTIITTLVLALVAYLSFFAATVPGETLDKTGRDLMAWAGDEKGARADSGFALPFLSRSSDESLFGIFHRNLVVADADLVDASDLDENEKTLKLRGRDFRNAKLDRSDLQGADLTGARLDGASLVGANLKSSWMTCADLDLLFLSNDRIAAKCASARNANFNGARLGGAHMSGIDMQGAKLEEARLEGADLSSSSLVGASLSNARLEKADLTGGMRAQGANFLNAILRGADLNGAQLQNADFSSAAMQGAVLNFAHLQGAQLQNADLAAASLRRTKLQGADMKDVVMVGADLRGASIWGTVPPAWDTSGLTDLSELTIEPLGDDEKSTLKDAIDEISDEEVRARTREKTAALLDDRESTKWKGSEDELLWQSWVGMSPPPPAESYEVDLTTYLTGLMCSARWADGSAATGVARRATEPQFRGDVVAVYDGLRSSDCPASKTTPAPVMRALADKAEQQRGP
ncbi:MAG: pentapeptide repeat-containing protein, partial [Hyphomicrobium sp.]